jgi:hypothetical protein
LSQVDPRIPQDRKAWVIKYRVGEVENVFGDFDCDADECECQFVNLADFMLHSVYGRHGPLGDRDAEMKRLTLKFYSRQDRAKERIYRKQQRQEDSATAATLDKDQDSDSTIGDPGDLEVIYPTDESTEQKQQSL